MTDAVAQEFAAIDRVHDQGRQEAAQCAGARSARTFWMRVATWVTHTRVDDRLAWVLDRVGDHRGARAAARPGLDRSAALGREDGDRAFLRLQRSGALDDADAAAAAASRADAESSTMRPNEASRRDGFAAERDRLFGAAATGSAR